MVTTSPDHDLALTVEDQLHFPMQYMEGFFLLLVVLLWMKLARQSCQKLFAISRLTTVIIVSPFFKFFKAIVMGIPDPPDRVLPPCFPRRPSPLDNLSTCERVLCISQFSDAAPIGWNRAGTRKLTYFDQSFAVNWSACGGKQNTSSVVISSPDNILLAWLPDEENVS